MGQKSKTVFNLREVATCLGISVPTLAALSAVVRLPAAGRGSSCLSGDSVHLFPEPNTVSTENRIGQNR